MSDGNLKVPSQVFRWFEKMKTNYENSVQSVLTRFENYNVKQQARIDSANQSHIESLKEQHKFQLEQNQQNIAQLHQDINYYKEQIAKQQQTIEQLNTRYDAVMACLLTEKTNRVDVKDIFTNDDFFNDEHTELLTPSSELEPNAQTNEIDRSDLSLSKEEQKPEIHTNQDVSTQEVIEDTLSSEELFEQAIIKRENNELEQAFTLFKKAAERQHARAMGAMGRSYFLGEGVEENQVMGLTWLIKAAALELPQAISRVQHFKENEPALYQQAQTLLNENDI